MFEVKNLVSVNQPFQSATTVGGRLEESHNFIFMVGYENSSFFSSIRFS